MLATLALGRQVIPLGVEQYDPARYEVVDKSQIAIVRTKDQVGELDLAHRTVKHHIQLSGSYALSPFSFNWNQHSQIYTIVGLFKQYSNHVVLSSCRVDAIARDPGLVQLINEFGATNLTCAIEGISENVCNFLQKSLMPEELYTGMHHIINQNFASVKMYYIYTGLESDADCVEFEGHLKRIDEIRRRAGKPMFEMRTSFTPLLSTLGTPLQYHGSKVSRSLKAGSNALFKIKHLCARYGFGIRLSSSIASSDFAQMVEFMDRRGQPLLEYLSLCGAYTFPKLSLVFYTGEEEVTKAEFDKLGAGERLMIDGRHYRLAGVDRITIDKLYAAINATALYPEMNIEKLLAALRAADGQPIPDFVLEALPPRRRAKLGGFKLKVAEDKGSDFVCNAPNGRAYYHMMINVAVNDIAADQIKRWLPMFTNGVTFEDLVSDKDALYIFPSMHIRFHKNRHIGQDFKQYVANVAFLFDSYCFNDALAKSLPGDTKVRVRYRLTGLGEAPTAYTPYEEYTSA